MISPADVKEAHERDDLFTDRGDAFDPADRDEADDEDQRDGRDERRDMKGQAQRVADGSDLGECPDAQQRHAYAEEREELCQQWAVQAAFQIIHRSACDVAFFILGAVADGEQAFRIFGGHAEECADPHPEQRAGTAGHDRSGDADDVSCANRRGQSGAQRLKAGYIAFFFRFLFAEDERKSELQPGQLQQLQPPGKVDAGAQQQDDERRAPDEIIDRCQQFVYLFQEKNLHSSTEAQKNGYHRRILCPFA